MCVAFRKVIFRKVINEKHTGIVIYIIIFDKCVIDKREKERNKREERRR